MARDDQQQRTALAVFLCILTFLFFSQSFLASYSRRSQAAAPAATPAAAATSAAGTPAAEYLSNPNAAAVPQTAAGAPATAARPSESELQASPKITVETGEFAATFTLLGGRVSRFLLKEYRARMDSDEPLNLISHQEGAPLPLGVHVGEMSDESVRYTVTSASSGAAGAEAYRVPKGGELSLTLTGTLPSGATIAKTLRFNDSNYHFGVSAQVQPPSGETGRVWLEWTDYESDAELHDRYHLRHFMVLNDAYKLHNVMPQEAAETLTDQGPTEWAAFADTYFIAAVIPGPKGQTSKIGKAGNTFILRASSPAGEMFNVYVGPKHHDLLERTGHQLERSIDLGIFSFLAYPLLSIIRAFFAVFGNYGLAIILLTLLIKTLFLPLTKASFTSMRAMQELQPEIKALRERVKDPTQLNQEMMALYKKRGVNPMGGCLPMLIQLPVFLGLYNALLNSIEMRHSPFALWIRDLSSPEYLHIGPVALPVMLLMMGATMLIQQWTTPTAADPQQKKIMMMMPFIFIIMFIVVPMPAGLVLYWLVNNTISIVQQAYLRGHRKAGPFKATALASVAIFLVGYVLTLL